MAPVVSVVLPCYNALRAGFLKEAIESVLAQSLSDFELIIIDDGSTDGTWDVISKIPDSRVRVFRQANAGLAATLNRGIAYASSAYIARQDQDDVMLPDRLARQMAFLDEHPEVGGIGSWADIMVGDEGSVRRHAFPSSHEALSLWLLFDNPFVHSSMLLRRDAVLSVGGYCEDRSRQPPEDFELWSRLARKYQMRNLDVVLTAYREVPGSMSRVGDNPFVENLVRISAENLHHHLDGRFSLNDCQSLAALYHGVQNDSIERPGYLRFWSMWQEIAGTTGAEGDIQADNECRQVRRQIFNRLASRFFLGRFPPLISNGLRHGRELFRRLPNRR